MKQLNQFTLAHPVIAKIRSLIALLLTCLAIAQQASAVVPAPGGGYPGGNTAEWQAALLSLTTGGFFNTDEGQNALKDPHDGSLITKDFSVL